MNTPEPEPGRILLTRASHRPSTEDVRLLLDRLSASVVSEAAVHQLIGAMRAINRWMADHPEQAPQLIVDPAAVLDAMQQAGVFTEPVDDLLAVLRSLRRDSEGKLTARARLVNFLRPTSAHFGRKPVLRFKLDVDDDEDGKPNERGDR